METKKIVEKNQGNQMLVLWKNQTKEKILKLLIAGVREDSTTKLTEVKRT